MIRPVQFVFAALAVATIGTAAHAATMTLVRDTWQDGDRTTPPAPIYSEAGVDADLDGDLESAWFNGGEGSVMTASPGNLRLDPADAIATWTTYMSANGTAVNLEQNHWVLVTWRFRTGDVTASNAEQNFRIAVVNSAPAAMLTADGSPPAGVYGGVSMFGNMAETTGNANAFQLRERDTPAAGPLLEDAEAWIPVANGLGAGAIGYADDTDYEFTMRIKRNVSNDLEISMAMTGGNIGGTGSVAVELIDTNPISFSYDTFSIYVGSEGSTASFLDTKLFMVELGQIPEPASSVLAAMSGLAVVAMRRACRRP